MVWFLGVKPVLSGLSPRSTWCGCLHFFGFIFGFNGVLLSVVVDNVLIAYGDFVNLKICMCIYECLCLYYWFTKQRRKIKEHSWLLWDFGFARILVALSTIMLLLKFWCIPHLGFVPYLYIFYTYLLFHLVMPFKKISIWNFFSRSDHAAHFSLRGKGVCSNRYTGSL